MTSFQEWLDDVELRFETGGDAIGREYHGWIRAFDVSDGNFVGYVDYAYYEGEIAVKMIEVSPEYRRKKIATKLLEKLKQESPDAPIVMFGNYATGEGQKFLKGIKGKGLFDKD